MAMNPIQFQPGLSLPDFLAKQEDSLFGGPVFLKTESGVDPESWQKHQGKTYEWLVFLKAHQVNLRESLRNQPSYKLLNRVIEHHTADIVLRIGRRWRTLC